MGRLFLLFFVLPIIWQVKPVSADISICNRTGFDVKVAMIYRHDHTFGQQPTYPYKGWYHFVPGECGILIKSKKPREAFFAVRKIRIGYKPYIMSFGTGYVGDYTDTDQTGIEKQFCIPKKPTFSGFKDNLEDFSYCSETDYRQLFNLYVKTDKRTNFTISIN